MLNMLTHAFHQVHMEADRKAMPVDANVMPAHHFEEKITYRVGTKVIFSLSNRHDMWIALAINFLFFGDQMTVHTPVWFGDWCWK